MNSDAYYAYMSGALKGAIRSLPLDLWTKKVVDELTYREIDDIVQNILERVEKDAQQYQAQYK